jgi:hypothetical protein
VIVFCGLSKFSYLSGLHQPRQNGQLLCTQTTKSALKDLECKCRSHTIAICRCGTRVDMFAQISVWLINKCTKRVLNFNDVGYLAIFFEKNDDTVKWYGPKG